MASRNIPACVGKTNIVGRGRAAQWEHPRVRGENMCLQPGLPRCGGTSPRARGKPTGGISPRGGSRNIPACAGKTGGEVGKKPTSEEHPRVRGENSVFRRFICFLIGTSPRARGKHAHPVGDFRRVGNIPACAGKTPASGNRTLCGSEHPRVRGENSRPQPARNTREGTSPRARGKPQPDASGRPRSRNIPACAGKTTSSVNRVNPSTGTSPRARGKPRPQLTA